MTVACPMCLGIDTGVNVKLMDYDTSQRIEKRNSGTWNCPLCKNTKLAEDSVAAAYRLGGLSAAMGVDDDLMMRMIDYIESWGEGGTTATDGHVEMINRLWLGRRDGDKEILSSVVYPLAATRRKP